MALTDSEIKLINKATPGLFKAKLGDKLAAALTAPAVGKPGIVEPGAAVAAAAGANPTKAEFDALLASLRANGVLAT